MTFKKLINSRFENTHYKSENDNYNFDEKIKLRWKYPLLTVFVFSIGKPIWEIILPSDRTFNITFDFLFNLFIVDFIKWGCIIGILVILDYILNHIIINYYKKNARNN